MCDHWYSRCEKCGSSVHKGHLCNGCGNDLHGAIRRMKEERLAKRSELACALKAVRMARKKLNKVERQVTIMETRQQVYQDNFYMNALQASLNIHA